MTDRAFEPESSIPLYRQLHERIKQGIKDRTYPVGSRIPTETELCEEYGISRITVRKALAELEKEGYLERRQGKGTFVTTPPVYHKDVQAVSSFHEACSHLGRKASTRVIRARTVAADDADSDELQIAKNGRVVEICRVRLADDVPVMLEINRFSMGFSYLLDSDLTGSLYNLLREYGLEASQATHDISLCQADEYQARLLGISPGTVLINLHEVIYDQKGRPLHTSRQYIRGELFTLRI